MTTTGTHTELFREALVTAYRDLFANDPEYAYSASRCTPDGLADKMLPALASGGANYAGTGIRRACKAVGIKHTGKAIREYLTADRE